MDVGIRDNYGQETSIRFLDVFNDWLKENTSGVVFIQVRDRKNGDWEDHFKSNGLVGLFTKPVLVVQYNWMRIQDYYHEELISLANSRFDFPFEKVNFSYIPAKNNKGAALNFHLTTKEKNDIRVALQSEANKNAFMHIQQINHNAQTDSSSSKENKLPIITQKLK
jgi:hypothetical protein